MTHITSLQVYQPARISWLVDSKLFVSFILPLPLFLDWTGLSSMSSSDLDFPLGLRMHHCHQYMLWVVEYRYMMRPFRPKI